MLDPKGTFYEVLELQLAGLVLTRFLVNDSYTTAFYVVRLSKLLIQKDFIYHQSLVVFVFLCFSNLLNRRDNVVCFAIFISKVLSQIFIILNDFCVVYDSILSPGLTQKLHD